MWPIICVQNGVIHKRSRPENLFSKYNFIMKDKYAWRAFPLFCQMGLGKICFTSAQLFQHIIQHLDSYKVDVTKLKKTCWYKNQSRRGGKCNLRFQLNSVSWKFEVEENEIVAPPVSKVFTTQPHSGRFSLCWSVEGKHFIVLQFWNTIKTKF